MLPLRTYPGPEVDEPGIVAEIHECNCHLLFFDLTEPKAARASFDHARAISFVDIGAKPLHGFQRVCIAAKEARSLPFAVVQF